MDTATIHPTREALKQEILRTILREAKGRFDRQIMDDVERAEIIARIKRLNRRLKLA
ncbi:MAG: hypothetical protein H0T57_04905 [Rubrobacter sp.]|nr:hypothetical protein [Rubrobacter sp.]